MRILILSVADLRHMTCVSSYCEFFEKNKIEFDIICTNRYKEKVKYNYNCRIYQYEWEISEKENKFLKIKKFLDFRRYVKKIISKEKYDYVVIWGENAALLFTDMLLLKFKNRYCVNIRDIDLYKNIITKLILDKCVERALFSTIPSPKGLSYLKGNGKILINKDLQILKLCTPKTRLKDDNEKINIVYMGLITPYLETFMKMIKVFANDERYILAFYGKEADTKLNKFVEENGYTNIICGGSFPPLKTVEYLNQADIINSYYPESNSGLDFGIGVKESYTPFLKIPSLCNHNCYWDEISKKYNFGFSVKDLNNMNNELYDWYHSLDFNELNKNCQKYIDFVDEINKDVYILWEKYFNCKEV